MANDTRENTVLDMIRSWNARGIRPNYMDVSQHTKVSESWLTISALVDAGKLRRADGVLEVPGAFRAAAPLRLDGVELDHVDEF